MSTTVNFSKLFPFIFLYFPFFSNGQFIQKSMTKSVLVNEVENSIDSVKHMPDFAGLPRNRNLLSVVCILTSLLKKLNCEKHRHYGPKTVKCPQKCAYCDLFNGEYWYLNLVTRICEQEKIIEEVGERSTKGFKWHISVLLLFYTFKSKSYFFSMFVQKPGDPEWPLQPSCSQLLSFNVAQNH